jgi:response regulator of citrate/malate metabolism
MTPSSSIPPHEEPAGESRPAIVSLEQMECAGTVEILVIDDDEMTCRVIRDALAHQNFRIETISDQNGVEAAIRGRKALHLVVLDYILPDLTPETVLAWLQECHADADVIVITGYPSVEGVQTALRARAYDYITKPFQLVHLRQTVMKCLEQRGLLRLSADALREAVGKLIRERRKTLGLTLAEMVERTGVSLGYLSQVELGQSAASIETLYRISRALGMRLSEMFAGMEY